MNVTTNSMGLRCVMANFSSKHVSAAKKMYKCDQYKSGNKVGTIAQNSSAYPPTPPNSPYTSLIHYKWQPHSW